MSSFSYTVAIVVPNLTNQFFSELTQQIQRNLASINALAIVLSSDSRRDLEVRHIASLEQLSITGVVFISVGDNVNAHVALRRLDCPVVVVDREIPDLAHADFVLTDNVLGSKAVVAHLIDCGYASAGYVAGDQATEPGRTRKSAFLEAARERALSIPDSWVIVSDFSFAGGSEVAKLFLSRSRSMWPPVMVFANDAMALGFLRTVGEAGIAVPADVSVVGFDDIPMASEVTPKLTTVRQETAAMAAQAVELLSSRMTSEPSLTEPRLRHVVPRLMERESTRSVP